MMMLKNTLRRTSARISALLALCLAAPSLHAADWPQFRGPTRDGQSPETGLLKKWPEGGPRLERTISGVGEGYSSPSIAAGKIYLSGKVGTKLQLFCFDLSGNKLWEQTHGPAFREEDALAGASVSDAVRLRQLVSKGSGGQLRQAPAPPEARANEGGVDLRKEPAGALAGEGFEIIALEFGVQLFSDRRTPSHFAQKMPEALNGAQYLRVPMDGSKTLRATRAGIVFVLTPQPDRNRDSQAQPLIDQGFRLVALPEFVLLNATNERRNLVSLYQKEVEVGEVITIGKWAVPVVF
jgi:hypothetical protein